MLSIANSSVFPFIKKLESVQYNAALALTCVIRGAKLYYEPPVNDHKPPADNHKSMANDHKPPGNDHKQP